MGLAEYNRKRNFRITREPPGDAAPAKPRADAGGAYLIQKHAARRLHYDFRLELNGVLLSWSIPKGPSLDPREKRLAVHVEDHPLAYGDFEGIIPKGQYGGGTVLLWDRGTWEPQEDPVAGYAKGNFKFILKGEKLHGGFALIRLGGARAKAEGDKAWLLIKERDAQASDAGPDLTATRPESVVSGRTMEEIAADKRSVWHSKQSHVDQAGTPGARTAKLPARPRPPRAVTRRKPPEGDDWLHEIALPGLRVLARNERSNIQLFSDRGTPLPAKAARKDRPIGDVVRMLPAETLMVDGVVAPLGPGSDKLAYFLNDLMYLDGQDLTRVPLERRKALLEELVRRAGEESIRYVEHIAGGGADFYREACRLGIEAMVSRRADSRYDAKAGWVTVACKGKTTGKTKTPLPNPLPASRGEGTRARGGGAGAGPATAALPKNFRLTHPERVLWPDVAGGFNKLQLVQYYLAVADFVVPHIAGRPLSLFRCPDGMPADPNAAPACFFMKHPGLMKPRSLETHRILARSKPGIYMVARDLAGVLEMAQMSILEIHPWNATAEQIEYPDRIIFDLDPDPAVPWARVVEGAFEIRRRLAALELDSVVKTTGGKGLHIVVPFVAASHVTWDDAYAFSRAVSEWLAHDQPSGYVTTVSKTRRVGKIFIDYLRNHRGNTAIAPYSTRARPGAPVAVPLAWDELTADVDPRAFTVETVPARVAALKEDPWAATIAAKQRLSAKLLRAIVKV
ncbi:MAG TPA: non-homologous end-joining DNA ligase [Polyangia bacterium]|jgi:bifunctional non-homologous end joining protein LigD|nr:non-homologous end-joining DNA ligase [Polyangia bacterium]